MKLHNFGTIREEENIIRSPCCVLAAVWVGANISLCLKVDEIERRPTAETPSWFCESECHKLVWWVHEDFVQLIFFKFQ